MYGMAACVPPSARANVCRMPRGRHRLVSTATRISLLAAVCAPALFAVVLAAVSGGAAVLRIAVLLGVLSAAGAVAWLIRGTTAQHRRLAEEMIARRREREWMAREVRAADERSGEHEVALERARALIETTTVRPPQPLTPDLFARGAAVLDLLDRRGGDDRRVAASIVPAVRRPPVSSSELVPAYAVSMFGPAKPPAPVEAEPVEAGAVGAVAARTSWADTPPVEAAPAVPPIGRSAGRDVPAPATVAVTRMVRARVNEVNRRMAGAAAPDGTFDFFGTRPGVVEAARPQAPGFLTDELFGPEAGYDALVAGLPAVADTDLADVAADDDPAADAIEDDRICDPVAGTFDAVAPVAVEHRGPGVRFAPDEVSWVPTGGAPRPKPLPVDLTAHDETEEIPRIREERKRA